MCVCVAAGQRKVRERSEYNYFYEICENIFCWGAKGSRKGRVRAVLWKNNFEQPRTPHDLRTCSFQSSESCSAAPAFKAIGAKKMVALALRYPAFIHLHVTFSSRNCLPLYVANCLQAFDLLDGLADLARGTYPDISVALGFTQGADSPQPLLSIDLGIMGSYESWQLRGGHSRLSTEIFSPLFTSTEGVYIFLVSLVMCHGSSSLVSAPCYTSSMYTPWKTTISVFFFRLPRTLRTSLSRGASNLSTLRAMRTAGPRLQH